MSGDGVNTKDTVAILPEDVVEERPTYQTSSGVAQEMEIAGPSAAAASTTTEGVATVSTGEKRPASTLDPDQDVTITGTTTMPESNRQKKKRERGQNKSRKFVNSRDEVRLCPQVAAGRPCARAVKGDCRFEHALSVYMNKKPVDIGSECPVFKHTGHCDAGFRCRWLSGHVEKPDEHDAKTWRLLKPMTSAEQPGGGNNEEGEKTAALTTDDAGQGGGDDEGEDEQQQHARKNIQNTVRKEIMISLRKRQYVTPRSDAYLKYLDSLVGDDGVNAEPQPYIPDVPLRLAEKRRLDWRGAKVLAPLTTTGNLPFRQLCRDFGADVTYSEMALSAPLLQGQASEWALTRSHVAERDARGSSGRRGLYGVQLAGPKPGVNLRAAEVLSAEFPTTLDFIDLNCGCPIDLIFKSGAGSALLDQQGRLVKILKGMSSVSRDVPITCKIRTGVSDKKNTAGKLLARLNADACVSMVTLHGRSRQQRYSRSADWSYIADCAAQIKSYRAQIDLEDGRGRQGEYGYDTHMAFLGNGDIYSWEDWERNMQSGVDGCMVARGALIKPWVFQEITERRHIDKTAGERMDMLGQYCRNGLAYWGADQMGVDKTRRFMLEFMSFHHRYTPIGLLEQGVPLPMNERAPAVVFRNEQEKLLASESCEDWIKISEIFLGRASEHFKFLPKHKANATETEG